MPLTEQFISTAAAAARRARMHAHSIERQSHFGSLTMSSILFERHLSFEHLAPLAL